MTHWFCWDDSCSAEAEVADFTGIVMVNILGLVGPGRLWTGNALVTHVLTRLKQTSQNINRLVIAETGNIGHHGKDYYK